MPSSEASPAAGLSEDSTRHLPRILCLHGGGTNARIFKAQCRQLSAQLKRDFRFIYAEAPWISIAGPDVLAVYGQWGPFKRWLRWSPEQPDITTQETVKELDQCLARAVEADNACGTTGEVVAILGFSQGAKVAASVLYWQQRSGQSLGLRASNSGYRFGVLLAGSSPLVDLSTCEGDSNGLSENAWPGDDMIGPRALDCDTHKLIIPTLHVHGLQDRGLRLHRALMEDFCAPESTTLIEWDGVHRVPLNRAEVSRVAGQIRKLAGLTSNS
uniref:Esterase n=1 Tax=Didymella fabae TaxID=372025 RepID=ASC4_DIDFA|nr:RecName: Full=Esterase; AltName: Full=Ascochitine biosynthesis cluster protein 4 [Ascochyta fabae]QEN17972.1 serine hydrolase [Ascochyta fabae]